MAVAARRAQPLLTGTGTAVANVGKLLVIVFNQRSLVAFLWVGELVRTEG